MSKSIQSFREMSYALFIDLTDAIGSVSVDVNTGNIVFYEGAGDDRYHGAMVRPGSFHGFALNLTESDEWEVLMRFGDQNTHVLGVTNAPDEATRWLRKAADIIRTHAGSATAAGAQNATVARRDLALAQA